MNNLMRLFLSSGKLIENVEVAAWMNEQKKLCVCVYMCVNMWAEACFVYAVDCRTSIILYYVWSFSLFVPIGLHENICSFEPSWTIAFLLYAFFSEHGLSFVCNHVCRWNCKIVELWYKRHLANQNPGGLRSLYENACAHAVYFSLPPCLSPDFPHPNTWNLEWNGLVMRVGSR